MKPTANINFKLPFTLEQEGDLVVAHCPLLDVYSQGENEDTAAANLIEAIQLFIESCIEAGSIDSVLKVCGFVKDGDVEPQTDEGDLGYLDVPVSLLIQATNNGAIANR